MTEAIQRYLSRAADPGEWRVVAGSIAGAVLLGLVAASGSLVLAAAAVAASVVVLVVVIPELAIVLLVVQFFFLGTFVDLGYLPHAALWLPDLIIATLVLRALARIAAAKHELVLPRGLALGFAVLVAACLASAAHNGQGPLAVVTGLRFYVKYPLLFFALLNTEIRPKSYKYLFVGFVIIAAVQVPVSAYQYLHTGHVADANAGTMGLTGGQNLIFLSLTAMTVVIALAVLSKGRAKYGVFSLVLLLAPLFAGVRATLLLGPVVLAAALLRGLTRNTGRHGGRVATVALVSLAVIYVFVGMRIVQGPIAENSFSRIGGLVQSQTYNSTSSTGRITALRLAVNLAAGSPATLLLGYGPGSANTSEFAYGELNQSATFFLDRTQVSTTLPELGLVGLFAIGLLLVMAWRLTTRARFGHGPMGDALVYSGPVVVAVFVLMQGYFAAWTGGNATPLLFWLVLAAIYVIDREPAGAELAPVAAAR